MKKKVILGGLIFLIVSIVVNIFLFRALYYSGMQEVNRETEAIMQAVHEAYPDVPEEDLVKILQNREGQTELSLTETFLEKYGYKGDFYYSETIRGQIRRFAFWSGTVTVCLTGIGILLFWFYERHRRQKVEDLIRYTQEIARGVYDLRIDANSEDVLSRLSNALYKITVLLKESAENSRRESEGLSRSLADISHQIKTPLTSIQIMLDNLADNPEMDPETRQDFLRTISSQTDKISSLVVSLLHLARFDSGVITMNPQETDIGQMVTDIFRELSMLAEVRGVTLVQDVEPGTHWTLDRKWQQQAISNIVKNAIEHSPAGGTEGTEMPHVTVTVVRNSLFLKVAITDQGEGISSEDQRHIFERFYKAENSSADSIGIGLNFAKTVIEKESGTISVKSVPGQGTTFTIRYMSH